MEVYDNFHVAPLEEQDPAHDGDDQLAIEDRLRIEQPRTLMAVGPTPTLVVPFRPCRPGDQGDHVYALKRMHVNEAVCA